MSRKRNRRFFSFVRVSFDREKNEIKILKPQNERFENFLCENVKIIGRSFLSPRPQQGGRAPIIFF